jgi:hypothetical protein
MVNPIKYSTVFSYLTFKAERAVFCIEGPTRYPTELSAQVEAYN